MAKFMNVLSNHLFVVLLTIGIFLSYVVRVLFDASLGGVTTSSIAIGICLVCLALYFVKVWRANSRLHNPDNLYYMGLLFTLSSLVYSLITLFLVGEGGALGIRVYNLIGSFGIALISTFAGILFRILVLQRIDLLGLEEEEGTVRRDSPTTTPEEEIAANVAMAKQMEKTVRDQTEALVTLSSTIMEKLTDMVDEIAMSIENVYRPLDELGRRAQHSVNLAKKNADDLEQGIQDSVARITDGGEKLEAAISAVVKPLGSITEDLQTTNQSTQQLSAHYDALCAKLQQATTSVGHIGEELEKVTANMSETTLSFADSLKEKLGIATDEITASMEKARQPLDQLFTAQVEQVRNSVATMEKSTAQLEQGMLASSEKISQGGEQIEAAVGTVVQPLQGVVKELQDTNQNAHSLATQYDAMSSNLQQTMTSISGITEQMQQAAQSLTAAADSFSGALGKAAEVTPQYTEQFAQLIPALRKEAEEWQAMTQEVRSSLVDAVEKLSQAVQRS